MLAGLLESVLEDSLNERKRSIIKARYGIGNAKSTTLEGIGKKYGITRERVRQIEESCYRTVRNSSQYKDDLEPALEQVEVFIGERGGVVTEEKLIFEYAQHQNIKEKQYLLLLLSLGKGLYKIKGNNLYKASWTTNPQHIKEAKIILDILIQYFRETNEPASIEVLLKHIYTKGHKNINKGKLEHIISISKVIDRSPLGLYGLHFWKSISPKSVRDKIFLVFEEQNTPLHFRDIATLIDSSSYRNTSKQTHPQTVHNELIKNEQFVLIGRGRYALTKWGYTSGTVKDVIINVLKQKGDKMHRDDIIEQVLQQREVKKSTVLLNLQSKKDFKKIEDDHYLVA